MVRGAPPLGQNATAKKKVPQGGCNLLRWGSSIPPVMEGTSNSMTNKQGNWFAEAMEEQGRQSGWLARHLGVHVSRVSEWKAGMRIPAQHVPRIRELLGLDES